MSRTQKPLPNPPDEYNRGYMNDLASLVIDEESVTMKNNRDNVVAGGSIILKDTSNNNWYKLKVTGGTLGVTLVAEDSGGLPVTSTNPYV
mgnify:CR=1 FL=1|tara:strand:- start:59 stop:328 length:270 start_codon:yes stop_codon:yes gene_type:complete